MLTKEEYQDGVRYTLDAFRKAGIAVTDEEAKKIEVADFGLGKVKEIGLQLLTYVNTQRCCAKEMVLRPYQTCPEHYHVSGVENGVPFEGKEETFRVRAGECLLYVSGEGDEKNIRARMPQIYSGTRHWFQAGADGAIISEFSTRSRDESDVFEDERIRRIPEVK